jgi:hypothetical protein
MNPDRAPSNPRVVMWSAIGGSIVLLGVLLALGWDNTAWSTAAGVLLLACVGACIFAAVQSRSTDREVRRAVARLAASREADERRRAPRREPADGR